jgi:predicted oxidoreductase
MNKISLSPTLELSRIIYGMWRLADDADTSSAHVQAKIESCLAQGISSFDQADIYGDYASETVLGNCLRESKSLRDQMQIITKCDIMLLSDKFPKRRSKHYDTSAAHIEASVETSLKLMAIDHIDLLLIHRPDPFMDHHETGRALDKIVASGKVGAIGVSNFKAHDWTLLQSAMSNTLVTNQIEISLLEQSPFTNGDIAFLQEHGIAPMAWSPLAGGDLFTKSPALLAKLTTIGAEFGVDATSVAIAWLLAHPANILPVLGTNNLDRIVKISDANKVVIDRETWFELYETASGNEVP